MTRLSIQNQSISLSQVLVLCVSQAHPSLDNVQDKGTMLAVQVTQAISARSFCALLV